MQKTQWLEILDPNYHKSGRDEYPPPSTDSEFLETDFQGIPIHTEFLESDEFLFRLDFHMYGNGMVQNSMCFKILVKNDQIWPKTIK